MSILGLHHIIVIGSNAERAKGRDPDGQAVELATVEPGFAALAHGKGGGR
jgi:hypothetical protein